MPTEDELNDMSQRIAGMNYAGVANPANRMEIMRLTLAAISADALSDIRDAAQSFAKDFEAFLKKNNDNWENLDHELTKIGEWFKASRVFDGIN
jgi:hypothetical protein